MPSPTTDAAPPSPPKSPRVLTVLPDFPWPANTGLHLRHLGNLDLVHRLGCYSALLYFTTEEREPPPLDTTPLARICDEVRHGGRRFPHSQFSTAALVAHKLDFLLRGVLGLPGKRYPFSMSYDRIGAADIVLAEAQRVRADYVVLPSFMVHYAPALTRQGFRVIADAIDVLTDLTGRFLSTYARNSKERLTLYANYVASRTQERRLLPQCREIWATSSSELKTLQEIAPNTNVLVVANTVDESAFQPLESLANQNVGFIGTYSSLPNLEAAWYLAKWVFPEVIKQVPRARLRLAGANLPRQDAAALSHFEYVDLMGAVADSVELYRDCEVIALPVFVRGGVPLKIVEALARSKAVVACPDLVQGLGLTDGQDVLIRTRPEDFASAICMLLSDRELRQRLGRNGRETFMRNWSRSHAEEVMRRGSVLCQERFERDHA